MQKAEEPELRLFVFHHSGGSHLAYRDWPSVFPAGWEVRVPDAPGRGPRDGRPPLTDAGDLFDHFLRELDGELTGRYAFFGHSMGGLVAYELARLLVEAGRTPPVWLGISARGTLHPDGDPLRRHLLSDADLRDELVAMGGTSPAVLEHQELWELFEPVIRADLRMSESWRTKPLAAPLPVPLSVFGGTRDEVAPPHRLDGWAEVTEHFQGRHLFEGGHFYFQDRLAEVSERIQDEVRRALLVRAPSAAAR